MKLLRPLLLDGVPSIQHNAAQALGRLASYNAELASAVVTGDILPQLIHSLGVQNVGVIFFRAFFSSFRFPNQLAFADRSSFNSRVEILQTICCVCIA